MGGSKVLSYLPPKALAMLGLDAAIQTPSPRYVIHAGPNQSSSAQGTLLIENPQAFENAVTAGLSRTMSLVCTYGFALAYLGQARIFLPECPEHARPIVLQRCGQARSLTEIFAAKSIYFWGDLDVAALRIYLACRAAVPHLRLSAIYRSMEGLLGDVSTSHPYASVFDKDGQANMAGGMGVNNAASEKVSALFERCLHRGIDQESVSIQDIALLGQQPY